jgi:hypothetical protein
MHPPGFDPGLQVGVFGAKADANQVEGNATPVHGIKKVKPVFVFYKYSQGWLEGIQPQADLLGLVCR